MAGDEKLQIEFMIKLHDSFKEGENRSGLRWIKFWNTVRE